MTKYLIYTDGACSPNPGKGGWGAVIINRDTSEIIQICGNANNTTNNRMEITAVINAIRETELDSVLTIYSDSSYVVNSLKEWIYKWKRNRWMKGKKSIKNLDLWLEYLGLSDKRKVEFIWVRGHNGNHYNEMADKLANDAIGMKHRVPDRELSLTDRPMSVEKFGDVPKTLFHQDALRCPTADNRRLQQQHPPMEIPVMRRDG